MSILICFDEFASEGDEILRIIPRHKANGAGHIGGEVEPLDLHGFAGRGTRWGDHDIAQRGIRGGKGCEEVIGWARNIQGRVEDRFFLIVGDDIRLYQRASYAGETFLTPLTA